VANSFYRQLRIGNGIAIKCPRPMSDEALAAILETYAQSVLRQQIKLSISPSHQVHMAKGVMVQFPRLMTDEKLGHLLNAYAERVLRAEAKSPAGSKRGAGDKARARN
jgi:hypothetical protein